VNAPDILRGQLSAPVGELKGGTNPAAAFALSNVLLNFASRPQFIAYSLSGKPALVRLSEAMGAMRVCWTARREGGEGDADAVIFEGYRPAPRFR